MPFSWVRPATVEFPLVFGQFQAFGIDNVKTVAYRIVDLPESRFEDVIEIMKDKHLCDEPMYSSKGIRDDPTSFQEMIANWRNMLQQRISIVCFREDSDEIVAVNILGVVSEAEFDAPHNVSHHSKAIM